MNDVGVEAIAQIAELCQQSSIGKLLPNAFYIHISALKALDPRLQDYLNGAKLPPPLDATLVKFSTDKPKISYLFYPDFDSDPHPALKTSIQVDLETQQVTRRDYFDAQNPPILHRKETFVTPDYPLYEQFTELTHQEEVLGLLNHSSGIGTKENWQQRLNCYHLEIQDHRLSCQVNKTTSKQKLASTPRIDRHKAAIVRKDFSRPVRLALEANLFQERTFFDYGCGHGGDVVRVADLGFSSLGWDPYYSPDTPHTEADIVNIGFVINVIEDQAERREALINAWNLTRKVLLVAAQVLISDRDRGVVVYGDGIITRRNTFQKYYEQEELKTYIDTILGVEAIPAGLGVYFVFRDEGDAESFRASRFRSRATTPKIRNNIKQYEDYQELLAPLMAFVTERGRIPVKGELVEEGEIKAEFGTFRRAFGLILQVTDPQEWEAIAEKRRLDLQAYLALSLFSRRPKPGSLSPLVREDIKALFGSYREACYQAEDMLFGLGDLAAIAQSCQDSPIGKKLSKSLWIHVSAMEAIAPFLRLYEGCASRTIGRMEDVTVIKFHTRSPKISYLYYPDFDTDPHPVLQTSMSIDLRDLHVSYQDYEGDNNPPILHQKDTLLTPDYPNYDKFSKLTQQEESWGLLDDWRSISHLQGWLKRLETRCVMIKSYQLRWRKDADPYKLKVLQAEVRNRQRKHRQSQLLTDEQSLEN